MQTEAILNADLHQTDSLSAPQVTGWPTRRDYGGRSSLDAPIISYRHGAPPTHFSIRPPALPIIGYYYITMTGDGGREELNCSL